MHSALVVPAFGLAMAACGGAAAAPATPAPAPAPDARKAECRRIVHVIDDDDAKLKTIDFKTQQLDALAQHFAEAAAVLDTVQRDLALQRFTEPELARGSSDYRAFAADLAEQLRIVSALARQLAAPQERLPRVRRLLVEAVTNLRDTCAAAPSERCATVMDASKSAPDAASAEDAAAIAAFSQRMSNVHVGDVELDADADRIAKLSGELARFVELFATTLPQVREAERAFVATSKQEAPIIDRINRVCAR